MNLFFGQEEVESVHNFVDVGLGWEVVEDWAAHWVECSDDENFKVKRINIFYFGIPFTATFSVKFILCDLGLDDLDTISV